MGEEGSKGAKVRESCGFSVEMLWVVSEEGNESTRLPCLHQALAVRLQDTNHSIAGVTHRFLLA